MAKLHIDPNKRAAKRLMAASWIIGSWSRYTSVIDYPAAPV
jgi:hypothetical protein